MHPFFCDSISSTFFYQRQTFHTTRVSIGCRSLSSSINIFEFVIRLVKGYAIFSVPCIHQTTSNTCACNEYLLLLNICPKRLSRPSWKVSTVSNSPLDSNTLDSTLCSSVKLPSGKKTLIKSTACEVYHLFRTNQYLRGIRLAAEY